MPYKTVIRLLIVARNPANDFSARLLGACGFSLGTSGEVTVFLRDRDTGGSYTEIGSSTVTEADWQGGTSDFVEKTATISGIDYTLEADHQLEVKVIVPSAGAPATGIWFAYDTTTYISVANLP